jgi:hypothetical protein
MQNFRRLIFAIVSAGMMVALSSTVAAQDSTEMISQAPGHDTLQNQTAQPGQDAAPIQLADPAVEDSRNISMHLPEGLTLAPHLYGHFRVGQVPKGTAPVPPAAKYLIENLWSQDGLLGVQFDADYKKQLHLAFGLEGKLYFSYPMFDDQGRINTRTMKQDFYVTEFSAAYAFGDPLSPAAAIQIGYFPFKYNPDVRNLGEYLYRSGTYPAYIVTDFDFPKARLLGLHVSSNLFSSLHQDLLFTTETYFFPIQTWSLSYLANYDIAKLHFIDIGAGVDFAHLISVYNDSLFSDKFPGGVVTPHNDLNARYIDESGDTVYYTFQGTKVMARLSIDPKAFIKSKYFGESDLRIYAEACIIGVKNYPETDTTKFIDVPIPSYNHMWDRMPVSFGFNVPTFRILDVLNFEFEWFGSKYLNDYSRVLNTSSAPVPLPAAIDPSIREDKWKWSIYAKRSFFSGRLAVTTQFARDHMRVGCVEAKDQYGQEALVEKSNWWWTFQTSWGF